MLSAAPSNPRFGSTMDMPDKNYLVVHEEHAVLPLSAQQKESLLMLIVINYAEAHGLLNAEQLEEARASLRVLFLHAAGEETMLRKIIGILTINRALNRTFGEMASVLAGLKKSHQSLTNKHRDLEQQLAAMVFTPEENSNFVQPLLEFSSNFVLAVTAFERQMAEYTTAKELEARSANIFRLAQEARDRLKQRFDTAPVEESRQEKKVKRKVFETFNYAEAESEYKYNKRSAKSIGNEISASLKEFHLMCQMAMKPEMRSPHKIAGSKNKSVYPDIYTIVIKALGRFPGLHPLIPFVQDQLKLYQRSFGMFMLDYEKLNKSMGPMNDNAEAYFLAKEQDEDVRTKLRKLAEIEALIAYIEDVARMIVEDQSVTYPQFSIVISKHITRAGTKWAPIAEQLIHMKLTAEAELSTRLG